MLLCFLLMLLLSFENSCHIKLIIFQMIFRPQEIDEAARRRFVKRLYIPLPEFEARCTIIWNLLKQQSYQLTEDQLNIICSKTDGMFEFNLHLK